MVSEKDKASYRSDARAQGRELSAAEREKLLRPYLPTPREVSPDGDIARRSNGIKPRRKLRRKRVRTFVKSQLHVLLYYLIHLVFGVYIRLRQIYHATIDRSLGILYYHHRSPELVRKDVKNLSRLPEHLSVILTLKGEEDGGLEALMDEVGELCAWCASAGIPLLSVYEKSGRDLQANRNGLRADNIVIGVLKSYIPTLHSFVSQKLSFYFGPSPAAPHLRVLAPNYPSHSPSPWPSPSIQPEETNSHTTNVNIPHSKVQRAEMNLLLLSSTDGRDTIVDLTRTLTEMSQAHKLRPKDITSELINTEICATTSISSFRHSHSPNGNDSPNPSSIDSGEPDLLIIFGPYVKLDGYPPWQVRLTEIFCVGDSGGDVSGRVGARVEYQAFLRGLWKYAGADMKFGR
jgi:dehydrodolichyl diphosphate syntase complex subunit NUS1